MRPSKSEIARIFESNRMLLAAGRLKRSLRETTAGPLSCDFALSDACQHKCGFCVDGRDQVAGPIMDAATVTRILRDLAGMGVGSVNFEGGGEPTLGPIAHALEWAVALHMRAGLITNGNLLDRDDVRAAVLRYASYVRVSLDAWDAASHEAAHGVKGQFERIVRAIGSLAHARDDLEGVRVPVVGIGMLIDEASWGHMIAAVRTAWHTGADYVAFRPIWSPKYGPGFFPRGEPAEYGVLHDQAVLDAKRVGEELGIYVHVDWDKGPFDPGRKCYAHRGKITVGADGTVSTCCNKRYEPDYSFGRLTENTSLADLWRGEQRQKVVAWLENPLQDMRRHCSTCNQTELNATFRELAAPSLHADFL